MLSWNFYIIPPGIITVSNVSLYLTDQGWLWQCWLAERNKYRMKQIR